MSSDVEIALAFVARRESKPVMSAARWSHLLSFELGWMNPGQARGFVDRAVTAGLLADDPAGLRLVIDAASVQVPRGFRPNPDAVGARAPQTAPPEADPFLAWVAKLAAHQGQTREQVLGRVAAVQERMGGFLAADAAVLWLAREAGFDVAAAAEAALRGLQAKP